MLLYKPTWPAVEGGVGAVRAVRERTQIKSPRKRELFELISRHPIEAAAIQDTSEIPG